MIGLLDLDWNLSTSVTSLLPNLEIMKLASYYKIEQNQFCRLLSFNDTDLNSYDQIYICSELHPNAILPPQFLHQKNIIFSGSAFTKEKYIPFKNELIDFTIPRVAIYKEALKQKYEEGVKTKIISKILDNTYYRNYAGNKKLPLPPVLPNKQVILYDRDFFYPDWKETMQEIGNRNPSSILRVHPIICKTLSNYFDARNCPKISRTNSYILDIDIPLSDVNYMLKKYQNLFLADITVASNIKLYLGGTWSTKLQYGRDLIYKLNLLLAFWSKKINIKFFYKSPEIGVTNPFEELERAIVLWSHSKKRDMKIIDKITKKEKNNYVKEQYEEILKLFPSSKPLFVQSFEEISRRGYWNI